MSRFESLQDWLNWIESCHPTEIELGLDRVGEVAQRLKLTFNLRFNTIRVITVAGTNGKGSCVASLNALLMSAGCRVGCYTSPHFLHYNERIQINGEPIDDHSLIHAFECIDQARGDTRLTYFEFGTLAALEIFQHSELDMVLLEVGLGGRLDAVNIIDPDIAIVTCIAIDHQAWLGSDREQIGAEKAGIFRAGKPALCADPSPPDSLRAVAERCGARFYARDHDFTVDLSFAGDSSEGYWAWQGQSAMGECVTLADLPKSNLPMDSVAVAIQAVQLLGVKEIDYQCLSRIQLPGRFQSVAVEGHKVILDVAHNPAAARYLAAQLTADYCAGQTFAIMAIMNDKDGEGMLAALKNNIDAWFLADLKHVSRAMVASELATLLHQQGIQMISVSKNVRQALRQVLSLMEPEDRLVVLGSFFTVAEVMRLQVAKSYG
ncbi:MAG: bifunctional tetrahydrofolate synthase/dihydrofolate synthase [Pseudomonadales bacterium]